MQSAVINLSVISVSKDFENGTMDWLSQMSTIFMYAKLVNITAWNVRQQGKYVQNVVIIITFGLTLAISKSNTVYRCWDPVAEYVNMVIE